MLINNFPIFLSLYINILNAELNPICHLLALLEAHHILDVSRIRVKLTKVLIINYSIIINNIIALMYTVWHADRYKIIFKLVINLTNEIL